MFHFFRVGAALKVTGSVLIEISTPCGIFSQSGHRLKQFQYSSSPYARPRTTHTIANWPFEIIKCHTPPKEYIPRQTSIPHIPQYLQMNQSKLLSSSRNSGEQHAITSSPSFEAQFSRSSEAAYESPTYQTPAGLDKQRGQSAFPCP